MLDWVGWVIGWVGGFLRQDQFLDHLTVIINQSSSAAVLINKTGSANALPRYSFQKVKADNANFDHEIIF